MGAMQDLVWEGNSRAMFERILADTPAFMRERALNGFRRWVTANGVTCMTEALLQRHVVETVPRPFQAAVLAKIAALESE